MNNLLVNYTNQKKQDTFAKMNTVIGQSFDQLDSKEYSELFSKDGHSTNFISIIKNSVAYCW